MEVWCVMKIKATSYVLIMAFMWIGVVALNIGAIKILSSNRQFLIFMAPMFIVIFVSAIFNCVYLYSIYKDFITLTTDSIIVNYGFKKKVLNLCSINSVQYNKNNMIFYTTDGAKKRISISFISKGDELALYKFLEANLIRITT
jgi:hypothetical protein